MILQNPFPPEVRNLYLGAWYCFYVDENGVACNANGVGRGGLELHHLLGRSSACAFNSCLLCGECHRKIVHNIDEHRRLFVRTLQYLTSIKYQPKVKDIEFIRDNERELTGQHLKIWLMS
jgi:hypothetical protein